MSHIILVIEDNYEMRENISEILKLANYQIVSATNGKEGVKLAQKTNPDLILCDILMPELDGYGVLYILSNDKNTSDIPFIFLTAKAEKSDFRTGMNLGADDYITKPFDGLDLLKVLEKRLLKKNNLKSSHQENHIGMEDVGTKERQVKEIRKLTHDMPTKTFKKKETIYMEGRQPYELHYLNKGLVKTFKSTPDGKELIKEILQTDSFLGYISILENTTYTESAVAMEESEIILIPKQDFLNSLSTNKDVATYFIKVLSNKLKESENLMLEMAYFSIRQRTAGVLLRLHEQFCSNESSPPIIAISRRDISDLVGTATESLNRALADFKEEGILKIHQQGISISDLNKLKKALN